MEYKISDFNGIPVLLFGCKWYSSVESRLDWNSKSCLDVHHVELNFLEFFFTLNNITSLICMKIYLYISDVYQHYFLHNNMFIIQKIEDT